VVYGEAGWGGDGDLGCAGAVGAQLSDDLHRGVGDTVQVARSTEVEAGAVGLDGESVVE
jgi:hypothetical protein